MPKFHYQPSFIGSFNSEKMRAFAKELWNLIIHYKESRKLRELTVSECDHAYLCHRFVPDVGTIQLIEDSEFGESDIFDGMNLMSIRQALALMPRNYPWLTVSSRENEADGTIQAIQDYQIFMHRKARTRRNVQRHLKQKNVRGRSAIYWEWQEEVVWRRVTDVAENSVQLKKWLKQMGMTKKDAHRMTNGRYPHVTSSGPVIYPIDWYDLWVDPTADLAQKKRPAKVVRRFRMLSDLMDEVDDNTDKPLYDKSLLANLKEYSVTELYGSQELTGKRMATQRIFGTNPTRTDVGIKYVPVYIVYLPKYVFNYNGQKEVYVDTYFHVALSNDGGAVIFHAEENPSDLGHSHILIDDCVDWYGQYSSGGIGLVEKQLSRYNQKNLLQLLMVTGAAHSLFPAQLLLASGFKDDEEISFLPGQLNLVQENPLGLDVMKPVVTPGNTGGVQLGQELLRFYGDDMRAGMGTDGLAVDNPARTMNKEKTATEVNRDMSTGSLYLDNQAENDSELLTDLTQAIFEESQRNVVPDREGMLDYERYLGTKVLQGKLAYKDYLVPRSIQVQGMEGAENRAQQMQDLLQGLDIATRSAAAFPQAGIFVQIALITIWKKLNIPLPGGMDEVPTTMQGVAQQQGNMPMPLTPEMIQGALDAIQNGAGPQQGATGAVPGPGIAA